LTHPEKLGIACSFDTEIAEAANFAGSVRESSCVAGSIERV
jgi:hypothetical protein